MKYPENPRTRVPEIAAGTRVRASGSTVGWVNRGPYWIYGGWFVDLNIITDSGSLSPYRTRYRVSQLEPWSEGVSK